MYQSISFQIGESTLLLILGQIDAWKVNFDVEADECLKDKRSVLQLKLSNWFRGKAS